MIPRDIAREQILRLRELRYFPAEDFEIKLLIDALEQSCDSTETAQRVIDEFIADAVRFPDCPRAAMIRSAARALRPTSELWRTPKGYGCGYPGCERGWIHNVRRVTTRVGHTYDAECVAPCPRCRAGAAA